MVFELCEVMESLCVETLGAVTAEFHEDARATSLAADSVSLTVERFKTAAVGAFVIDEFNHMYLSVPRDRASRFEPVH